MSLLEYILLTGIRTLCLTACVHLVLTCSDYLCIYILFTGIRTLCLCVTLLECVSIISFIGILCLKMFIGYWNAVSKDVYRLLDSYAEAEDYVRLRWEAGASELRSYFVKCFVSFFSRQTIMLFGGGEQAHLTCSQRKRAVETGYGPEQRDKGDRAKR